MNETGLDAPCAANETCDLKYDPLDLYPHADPPDSWTLASATLYSLICALGLLGNSLVIVVIVRYAQKKTVTDWYIVNLAVSDLCFLVGLPFLIATSIVKHWIFGLFMCRLFYILTSINWFTSVFILTVMSADRYMAVCHPVRSITYRTPRVAAVVCACVWAASMVVMLPIMLYATTAPHRLYGPIRVTCLIEFPPVKGVNAETAFLLYGLVLGFAAPVALISVFYSLVVLRLKTVGPAHKSKSMSKTHRRVTMLVLAVIAVYVVCWLPYWVFQVVLMLGAQHMPSWSRYLSQVIAVFSYANSMFNPVLYAFFNENFRSRFLRAFGCCAPCRALAVGSSVGGALSATGGAGGRLASTRLSLSVSAAAAARKASRGRVGNASGTTDLELKQVTIIGGEEGREEGRGVTGGLVARSPCASERSPIRAVVSAPVDGYHANWRVK